ncbi:MAG: MBL fold metallo-hydrolase [Syntrophobacteraceae bacterium]
MKIKFLGVGSAFTSAEYYHSNMLITAGSGKRILIDCGSDIRFSLQEAGIHFRHFASEIDAIYVSHLHADHIGGLEAAALVSFFDMESHKPGLFAQENVLRDLWNHSLQGGLLHINRKRMQMDDYFSPQPVDDELAFRWEGIDFNLVEMAHIGTGRYNLYSYGLVIKNSTQSAFISTDAQFQPNVLVRISEQVDLIFHDCETSKIPSLIHAHYSQLCTLPNKLKERMWLYHYDPCPALDPKADGFKGFVQKGQEFEF